MHATLVVLIDREREEQKNNNSEITGTRDLRSSSSNNPSNTESNTFIKAYNVCLNTLFNYLYKYTYVIYLDGLSRSNEMFNN
jgi:hypothetical protein